MKILSVSTATNHLSVALNDGQQIIVEKNERDERNHSEHLDPLIDEILKDNDLSLKDIDRFPKMVLPTDADLSGKTLPDKLDIQKELNIGKTNNSSTKKASDNKTTDEKDITNVSEDDAPAVRAVDIVKKKPIDAPK